MELNFWTLNRAKRIWLAAVRSTLLEEGGGSLKPSPHPAAPREQSNAALPAWQIPAYQRRQRSGDTVWCAPRR